jgi:hypothetical protein
LLSPHPFASLRIPFEILTALDSRELHFILQPWHYLIRLIHIVSAAAFFGGIGILDLRLLGWRGEMPLRSLADMVLPWLYAVFVVAIMSGIALFLYDPVNIGSHGYFTPKLALLLLGLTNACLFHRYGYLTAVTAEVHLPISARLAGGISLALWTGVMVCASLNVEGVPKVFLR